MTVKVHPGWLLCRVSPINLISPSAPMITHAAVRAYLLFYIVRPQSRGTFAVKQTDVFCVLCYVIFSKITSLDYK